MESRIWNKTSVKNLIPVYQILKGNIFSRIYSQSNRSNSYLNLATLYSIFFCLPSPRSNFLGKHYESIYNLHLKWLNIKFLMQVNIFIFKQLWRVHKIFFVCHRLYKWKIMPEGGLGGWGMGRDYWKDLTFIAL